MSQIRKIINTLKHTYEKNAWHGPAVMETLAGIDAKDAQKKVGDSHSIIELVAHMTAWRNYVTEKLKGNASFELSDEQNFPKVKNWSEALKQLAQSQQELIQALEATPDERLNEKVPNREFKFYTMLQGIIHHDLYHLGQIQLMKKYV
ncbi:MAG TPA: DinB family protein [Cyclobacteriaceae bacterium]|nr:DinB family protein [Cyclobacteriaceae bacterium]